MKPNWVTAETSRKKNTLRNDLERGTHKVDAKKRKEVLDYL